MVPNWHVTTCEALSKEDLELQVDNEWTAVFPSHYSKLESTRTPLILCFCFRLLAYSFMSLLFSDE